MINQILKESDGSLYRFKKEEKKFLFNKFFLDLTKHHYKNCTQYRNILDNYKFKPSTKNISNLPSVHVSLFKERELISVTKKNISSILLSSGTSTGNQSKIFVDRNTSVFQKKVLSKIFKNHISEEKIPIFFLENQSILKNSNLMNAKSAAISGFSLFGSQINFLLNENKILNLDNFIKHLKNIKSNFLVFGFTYDVYEKLIKNLNNKFDKSLFKKGILLHGGGWKKLENIKINNIEFNKLLNNKFGFSKIINYYGLIEQAGSIFFTCKNNNFHTSFFSDIDILDKNLEISEFNKKGIVQLKSLVPFSYPGHKIVTEDVGMILGEDNCSCGKMGKYFKIFGRLKKSPSRGCSNV